MYFDPSHTVIETAGKGNYDPMRPTTNYGHMNATSLVLCGPNSNNNPK